MNTEKLASFHVLVLIFTYLRPFGNMSNQHISDDLSAVPQRRYNQGYLGYTLKECKSQQILHYKFWGVITRNSFRPEHPSGLRPSVWATS